MYEQLLKTVTNLGSPSVLIVGDFILDTYIYGDAQNISPEAPVLVLKVAKKEYNCGAAASIAANIAALGGRPFCLGVIGDDSNGGILKEKLVNAGANIDGLLFTADRPTITRQRVVGLAQHRHPQQLIRIDEESTEPINSKINDTILQYYQEKLKDVDIICLKDRNSILLSESNCKRMIKSASQAGKPVIVDPAFACDYSKYAGATTVVPNRRDASQAVAITINTPDEAAVAAQKIAEKFKTKVVVITLDRDGAYLKSDQTSEHIPANRRNVYDVTGAGNMVVAVLSVTLAAGCDYETAVQLSNLAAGIEVEKFGSATVTIDEIVNEIISSERGKGGKVRQIDSLVEQLEWHRKKKDVIVFTNGCFDVLHRGHIEFLKFCKSHGNIVVLGLNTDSSVRNIKGTDRPINNQHDRAAVLAALETVDYITFFDEPTPLNLIQKVRPNVLIKGSDWKDKGVVGREFVESYGGKVELAPIVEGKSSTLTIEKMKSLGKPS